MTTFKKAHKLKLDKTRRMNLLENQKNFNKQQEVVLEGFEYFSQKSSIHGLRFLSKNNNSSFTRVFWSTFLILSLFGLFFHARRLYIKLNVSPDIGTTITYALSRETPFPAFTVCIPLFARDSMANYTYFMDEYRLNGRENLLNLTESEMKYLAANSLRCSLNRLNPIRKCCGDSDISNILELLLMTSQSIDEALASCSLRLALVNCREMFQRTVTSTGFCFTANMMDLDTIYRVHKLSKEFKIFINDSVIDEVNWTLDGGYNVSTQNNIIPIRLTKSNIHAFRIQSSYEDTKNTCNRKSIMIKIHLPNEIPTIFHQSFALEHGHELRLVLQVKLIKAHESLKSYSPHARGCYFEDEKELRFFKTYSKYHCYFECLTDYVLDKCGCVAFYMPRNSTTEVCKLDASNCLSRGISEWPVDDDLVDGTTPCECYPTCNHIEYSAREFDNEYDAMPHADIIKNFSESLLYSRVYLNFNDHIIQVNEKYVSYKLQNFVADIGGLLGLFLGCSILSMVEVLFFVCKAMRDRYDKKKLVQKVNIKAVTPKVENIFEELDKIGHDIYIVRSPLYKRGNSSSVS